MWWLSVVLVMGAGWLVEGDEAPTLFLSSFRGGPRWSGGGGVRSSFRVPMKTARFVVVSEGQYDHDHHTHHHVHHPVRTPHFAPANETTRVFLGATASLDCTVHDVTNESVSWMRRVDDMLELLTWDTHTYASDDRYSLVLEAGERWQRWQLVVRDAKVEDRGQYRCQVATHPPMVRTVTLHVTEPVARVVDERGTKVVEKHYNSGSMIQLQCVIQSVPFPPAPVTWRRGPTTLSFNTSRGGISVKPHPGSGYVRSRLYVREASPADSGVYTCWYGNYTSDAVAVHVIAGENSAAMQHDGLPGSESSDAPWQRDGSGVVVWLAVAGVVVAACGGDIVEWLATHTVVAPQDRWRGG